MNRLDVESEHVIADWAAIVATTVTRASHECIAALQRVDKKLSGEP